jgi:alkylhydroperoxidase family enzyme
MTRVLPRQLAEPIDHDATALDSAQFTGPRLSRRHRELVALAAARMLDSEDEWLQHVAPATAVGVRNEQLAALDRLALTAECFDETDQAVLTFAKAIIDAPAIPDRIFETALSFLDYRQLAELVGLVGYWMLGRLSALP